MRGRSSDQPACDPGLALADRDATTAVEHVAARVGGIGEHAHVGPAVRRLIEHVAVGLLAHEIGEIDLRARAAVALWDGANTIAAAET